MTVLGAPTAQLSAYLPTTTFDTMFTWRVSLMQVTPVRSTVLGGMRVTVGGDVSAAGVVNSIRHDSGLGFAPPAAGLCWATIFTQSLVTLVPPKMPASWKPSLRRVLKSGAAPLVMSDSIAYDPARAPSFLVMAYAGLF